MRVNGSLHIGRAGQGGFLVTYTPLGQPRGARPSRSFPGARALAGFLARGLRIEPRRVFDTLQALWRNDSFCLYEVWLGEQEMDGLGLGRLWSGPEASAGSPAARRRLERGPAPERGRIPR